MTLTQSVRGCDKYGAAVNFKYKNESSYKTLAGGLTSICLRVLILAYFGIQLLAVVNFKDPIVSTYEILEERN